MNTIMNDKDRQLENTVTVGLNLDQLRVIDFLIAEGYYFTRRDFVKKAIRHVLNLPKKVKSQSVDASPLNVKD